MVPDLPIYRNAQAGKIAEYCPCAATYPLLHHYKPFQRTLHVHNLLAED